MDDLQDPLGRKQEVNEAAESVSSVLPLHHAEELPQDGGSSSSEGAIQGRQGALDTVIQRLSVLRKKTRFKIDISIRSGLYYCKNVNNNNAEGQICC